MKQVKMRMRKPDGTEQTFYMSNQSFDRYLLENLYAEVTDYEEPDTYVVVLHPADDTAFFARQQEWAAAFGIMQYVNKYSMKEETV